MGGGLDVVLGYAVALVVVFDNLGGRGGAFLGVVVVALRVTLICKHQMSFLTVQT